MARTMELSSRNSSSLEFFKVFLPDFCSLQMCIPPAFVKHLNGKLPSKGIVRDDRGISWHVTLEKLDNGVYFKNGWQAFVDEHFLKYGDFLIFQYNGNCVFDVKLFGKNGCKKELVVVAGHSVPNVKHEPKVEEEDSKPLLYCKRKHLEVGSSKHSDSVAKSRSISTSNLGKRNALRSAKHFAPKGPCFKRTMTPSSSSILFVPYSLLKEHRILLEAEVVLKDEEGKLWPVLIKSSSGDRVFLSTGWSGFYKNQHLRVNDKCEFEFVVGRGNVCRQINVQVTRWSLASHSTEAI